MNGRGYIVLLRSRKARRAWLAARFFVLGALTAWLAMLVVQA